MDKLDIIGYCIFSFAFGAAACHAISNNIKDARTFDDIGSAEMLSALVRRKVSGRMASVTEEQIRAVVEQTAKTIIKESTSGDPIVP